MSYPSRYLTTFTFPSPVFREKDFAYHLQPHLASLGLSESQISLALISGPLCGAVLQPVFGSWSDRYHSSWGRRKPFIVFGAIWLIASTLCLAWARSIIALLISDIATQETQDTLLSSFSILTVFSMYAAVQAVQIGMRALIIDGCSLPEQAEANAWAGRYIGVGGVLGNLAALLDDLSRQVERDNCRTILMVSELAVPYYVNMNL